MNDRLLMIETKKEIRKRRICLAKQQFHKAKSQHVPEAKTKPASKATNPKICETGVWLFFLHNELIYHFP
jgi:hypothetical protein